MLPFILRTDAKVAVEMLAMLQGQHCPARKLQLSAWNLWTSRYFQHFPSTWMSACWFAAQHEKMNNLLGWDLDIFVIFKFSILGVIFLNWERFSSESSRHPLFPSVCVCKLHCDKNASRIIRYSALCKRVLLQQNLLSLRISILIRDEVSISRKSKLFSNLFSWSA